MNKIANLWFPARTICKTTPIGLVFMATCLFSTAGFAGSCGPDQTEFDVKITYQVEDRFLAKTARSIGAPPELAEGKEVVVVILAGNKIYHRREGVRWLPKKKVPQAYEHIKVQTAAYSFDAKIEKGTGRITRNDGAVKDMDPKNAKLLADMLILGIDDFVNATVLGEKRINNYSCKITQTALKHVACYTDIHGHLVAMESMSTLYGDGYPRTMKMSEIIERGCEAGSLFDVPKDIKWK